MKKQRIVEVFKGERVTVAFIDFIKPQFLTHEEIRLPLEHIVAAMVANLDVYNSHYFFEGYRIVALFPGRNGIFKCIDFAENFLNDIGYLNSSNNHYFETLFVSIAIDQIIIEDINPIYSNLLDHIDQELRSDGIYISHEVFTSVFDVTFDRKYRLVEKSPPFYLHTQRRKRFQWNKPDKEVLAIIESMKSRTSSTIKIKDVNEFKTLSKYFYTPELTSNRNQNLRGLEVIRRQTLYASGIREEKKGKNLKGKKVILVSPSKLGMKINTDRENLSNIIERQEGVVIEKIIGITTS